MNYPMLSVIIPVYNKEEFLAESLDSVLAQTFTDSEIIVINDGSTDNSLSIIKEYQKKCDRIRIIDQKNAGVSAARNRGIEAAQGKYVIMFDADDLLEKDMHQDMVRCAEQYSVDMVCCNYKYMTDNGVTLKQYGYPYEEALDRKYIEDVVVPFALCRPDSDKFINTHWTLLIKRSVLIDNNIRYNELHRREEDKPFIMHTLRYTQSIAFVKGTHYIYRRLGGSLMSQYSPKFDNILRNIALYEELYEGIFDFNSSIWINRYISVCEECIQFVIIHKRHVDDFKSEVMHIIAHAKSKDMYLKAGENYSQVKRMYQNGDMNSVYRYYMKKYRKLRIKITIRDLIRR